MDTDLPDKEQDEKSSGSAQTADLELSELRLALRRIVRDVAWVLMWFVEGWLTVKATKLRARIEEAASREPEEEDSGNRP